MKKEFKSMTSKELNAELKNLKTELFNLRFSLVAGNLPNNMQISKCKKDIARVKTVLRERELKGQE